MGDAITSETRWSRMEKSDEGMENLQNRLHWDKGVIQDVAR